MHSNHLCNPKKGTLYATTTQSGTENKSVMVKLSDETGESCSATQLRKVLTVFDLLLPFLKT